MSTRERDKEPGKLSRFANRNANRFLNPYPCDPERRGPALEAPALISETSWNLLVRLLGGGGCWSGRRWRRGRRRRGGRGHRHVRLEHVLADHLREHVVGHSLELGGDRALGVLALDR